MSCSDFFCGKFSPFQEKYTRKGKKRFKKKIKIEIVKKCHDCLYNMKGCLKKIFLLSYFEYRQHWLNILMDDCHSSKITKLKNKNMDIIC